MKQKVAILGVGGMLGSMVLDVFAKDKNFSVIATVRELKEKNNFKNYKNVEFRALDVEYADAETLKKALKGASSIINCIGIIKPYIHDDNALEVERALRINALFPHILACAVAPAKIIQIATDCVYSGNKGKYQEGDPHDALDIYGKSKSIGEVYSKNMYNLRTSIIGPEIVGHVSLMDWFLTQPKNAQVNGFKNHFWNGITTLHFGKLCVAIVKKNISIKHLQHIVPSGRISKSEMLKIFGREFNRQDIKIKPADAPKVINRVLQTENSKKNKEIWAAAGYKKIPSVPDMIKELVEYMVG